MWNSVIVILCAISISCASKCTPSTNAANGPSFPQIFKNDTIFTMKTELNIGRFVVPLIPSANTYNTTYFFEEYYQNFSSSVPGITHPEVDVNGRVNFYSQSGLTSKFYQIASGRPSLEIEITGINCTVTSYNRALLNSSYTFWGFHDSFDHGDSYMYGPSTIWINGYHRFRQSDSNSGKPIFWKNDTVRGIKSSSYKACYNRDDGTSATAIYSVTADGQNPLMVSITGSYNQAAQGTGSQTYSYVFFERDLKDESIFQIPTGIGCDNMPASPKFLPPAPVFSFRAEVSHSYGSYYYNRNSKRIDYFTLFYDSPDRISTIINRNGDATTVHINDFNTGVTYSIRDSYNTDAKNTGCNIVSIADGASLDSDLQSEVTGTAIPHIQDPKDYFHQNSTFYRIGKTWTRGISVDIYETVRHNYVEAVFNKRVSKFVMTYYVAAKEWKEYSTEDNKVAQSQFPVRMKMVGYDAAGKETYNMTINYFDYSTGSLSSESMAYYYSWISDCFAGQNDIRKLEIVFPRQKGDTYIFSDLRGFAQATRKKISKINKVSLLRIPHVQIYTDQYNAYATVQITEALPPFARFTTTKYQSVPTSAQHMDGFVNTTNCALNCLNDTTCKVLYTCGYTNIDCYSDTQLIPAVGVGMQRSGCTKYAQTSSVIKGDISAEQIINKLIYQQTSLGGFEVTVNNFKGKSPAQFNFVATSLQKAKHQYISSKRGINFQLSLASIAMKDSGADLRTQTTTSLSDCETYCRKDKDCVTISFCDLSGQCKMSTIYMDEFANNSKYLTYNTGCNIYIKPYLSSFFAVNGKVTLEPADKQVDTATSEAKCAKACVDEKSFSCRSFQYCTKSYTCLLHKNSYLGSFNATFSRTKKMCSFFHRFIMEGFAFDGPDEQPGYSGTLLENLSFDDCYDECNKDSTQCNSYDFCHNGTLLHNRCILHQESHAPSKQKYRFQKPLFCERFRRIVPVTDPYKGRPVPSTGKLVSVNSSSSNWSSGGAAGLCIGLLVVGALVGAVLYFAVSAVQKRRSVGGGDMSISFSKQQDME